MAGRHKSRSVTKVEPLRYKLSFEGSPAKPYFAELGSHCSMAVRFGAFLQTSGESGWFLP